jgi:arylsulfatase A-like enzyme
LALEFLRSHAKSQATDDRPFALVMSWGPPHTPFIAPPEFAALYDPEKIVLRANVQMRDWLRFGDQRRYDGPHKNPTPEIVLKDFTARYYAAISNLDHNFGRLLKLLEDLDLAGNSVVVFTSDHGEMLGSHGQLHKLQPWDESVRVPFLIRYPGPVQPGLRCEVPLGTPDILATLFGLMRLRIPQGVEGADLSPLLRGQVVKEPPSSLLLCVTSADTWSQRWTDCVIGGWGYPPGFLRPYRGIRTRTHTYVRDLNGPWFFYDNERDPYQLTNLAEKGGKAAIPPELDKELDGWLERTGDFFGGNADYQKHVDLRTGMVLRPEGLRRGI